MTEQKPVSKQLDEEIMDMVNKSYSDYAKNYVAKKKGKTTQSSSCCEPAETTQPQSTIDLIQPNVIPTLGCDQKAKGGLLGFAKPQEGEVVIDLGSGPGRDSIAAAKMVGSSGRAIGVDFSDDMLSLARENAIEQEIHNVDYRKGNLIELPVDDNQADLVISNCVINLVPDKVQVFKEVLRVLKPGGRIVNSDMVGLMSIEDEEEFMQLLDDSSYCGCVGGAVSEERYVQQMKEAGFKKVEVQRLSEYDQKFAGQNVPYASSIFIGYKEI